MKTLRKGKGRNPYTDSDIKCKFAFKLFLTLFLVRLKIEVNGEQIFSNYLKDNMLPIEEQEDYKTLTVEQRKVHQ